MAEDIKEVKKFTGDIEVSDNNGPVKVIKVVDGSIITVEVKITKD